MKQFYELTAFLRKACCVLLLLFIGANGVFAQAETEPNNEANQAGTQRIYEGTTITGTVSSTDPDVWLMSKLPGIDPQSITLIFISSGDNAQLILEEEIRTGSHNGTIYQAARPLATSSGGDVPGYTTSTGWRIWGNYGMSSNDNYSNLRISTASVTPIAYTLVLTGPEDFPACTIPANANGLSTTQTGSTSLQLDTFSAVSGITGGYVVEINDTPTFNALPDPQFTALTNTTSSTAYSGSGQQIVYTSPTPSRLLNGFETPVIPGNINVTGLNANTTYYYRVTTANECNGYFNFSSGTIVSETTCGTTPNQVTGITASNNAINSFELNSFGVPVSGADGYVVKVNKTNSFTAPVDGASLPSASTTYNLATGDQVVYTGTSNIPNVTITGSGVSTGETFFIKVYAYYNCGGINYFENTGTTVSLAICNGAPTVTPSALSIDQISHNAMRVNSTSGANGATGQVILVNTVNSFTSPVAGALPTANTSYSGTGQQVIYAGNAVNPAVTVTNLTNTNGGTQYFFKSYAYDSCGTTNYFESTGVNTNATTCGAVQNVANNEVFFEVGDSFMDFTSFGHAVGVTGYVVKMNTTNSFTAPMDGSASLPAQNTNYTGGEQVVYAGTSSTPDIRITGLSAATTYHFTIYSYTDCNGALFYEQTGYHFSRQNVNPSANLTFNDFSVTYDGAPFDMNTLVTSLSPGAKTYSIVGGTSPGGNVLSGAGNAIMDSGTVGTVLVRVDQEAAAGFNSGTIQATMTIVKANPIINFDNQAVSFGSGDVTLSATSNSTGTITYSIVGNANGNVLSGNTLTPGNAGVITLQASITTDANYNAATKDVFFSVSAPTTIISNTANAIVKIENGIPSTLYSLTVNPTNRGQNIVGGLLEYNGQLWGVTKEGGTNNFGIIFYINPDGTGFTKVHDFEAATGVSPEAGLTVANGKLWGTAPVGGTVSGGGTAIGTIYNLDPVADSMGSHNFQAVHNFGFATGGIVFGPRTRLKEANGRLWGCTASGFGSPYTVGGYYSIKTDGTDYTLEFAPGNSLRYPNADLTLVNGMLWGGTGGENTEMVRINPVTRSYVDFQTIGPRGASSTSTIEKFFYSLVEVSGKVYGIYRGDLSTSNPGFIFSMDNNFTNYQVLHTFDPTSNSGNGLYGPTSKLVLDGTQLWGSTSKGGANGNGGIFSIETNGTNFGQSYYSYNAGETPNDPTIITSKQRLTPVLTFANQTVDYLSVSTLTATTNSTGAISYSLINDTTGSSINGNDFTAGNVGTVTVRASLAQDNNFLPATADATFTINKINPTFTIADINTTFDSAIITLAPSATNYTGGTVTYEFVDPTDTNTVATTGFNTGSSISGDQLTLGTPGTEMIRVTLAGNSNFNEATFDFRLTIGGGVADLSGFTDFTAELFQSDITLSIPTASGVAVNYQLLTSNTGSSLSGTNNETLSIGNISGTETIRVIVTEPNYNPDTKEITLTVNKANPVITWGNPADVESGTVLDGTQLNASTTIPGVFAYYFDVNLSNPIVSGSSTLSTLGSTTIYSEFVPTDQVSYNTIVSNVTFNVTATLLEITADDLTMLFGDTDPTLTFTITQGQIAPGELIFIPLTRETGTALGNYAITVDATAVPNPNPTDLFGTGGLACSGGICVYTSSVFTGGLTIGENRNANYSIQFVPGTLSIINKTPITAIDIAFNAPASLMYDRTAKTYTVTPDSGLSPALPAGDIDLTYEGRNGTVYASSATAPTNAGDYRVTATVNASNADYAGSVSLNFSITPVDVTITADAKSKTYGDADPVLTYQLTAGALIGSDALSGSLTRVTGEDVGTYAIQQGSVTAGGNYAITFVSNDLTVTTRAIEITADAKSKTFGDADPTLTYQLTAGALQFSDTFTGNLSRNAGEGVGTYAIAQGGITAGSNYTITFVSDDLTIGQRDLEITADTTSKTYGDADPTLSYQITAGALQFSDVFAGSLSRVAGEGIGTYAIGQGDLRAGSNYNITFVSDDLTINQRAIEITADALNKQYGDTDPTLTYQITAGALQFSDAFTGALDRVAGENVGDYAINQGTVTLSGNYALSYVSNDLTISQRAIEITTDALNKVFGDVDPALTYQITSGSLAFSDAFTGNLVRVTGENVGTYAINQGTIALNANYNLTFVTNNFEITPADVIITVDAKSKIYGDSDPVLTYTVTTGSAIGSDAFTGSIERVTGENVGTYAINQGTLAVDPNYALTFVSNDLTIGQRAIEVTADPQSKIYGDADPTLTYQITNGSLAFSDTFSGTIDRATGETRGDYGISRGTLSLGANYNLVFVGNTLTINTRFIRVLPIATVQKTYGEPDPVLSVPFIINLGSLAFDDTIEVFGNFRDPGENVGNYFFGGGLSANITSTNGGESSYQITYMFSRSTYLEILPRAIEVTADVQTKAYGDADPTFSYRITNGTLQFSDAFTGTLSRATGENVGTYAINQGTLSAGSNYTMTYIGDDLAIGQRTIEITADALNKEYRDADPSLTYQITSGSLGFSDTFTGNLIRVVGENIGTYAINQGTVALNANYNLSYIGNDLTIGQRAVEVTADAKSKTYGDADPALTYQITSGSLAGSDAFTGSLERITGDNAGTYAINQGTLGLNSNYALTYMSNDFNIGQRAVQISADAQSKVYGDADPTLTYQITSGSLIGGDAFTGSLTRISGENVGNYAINQGSVTAGGNYNLAFVSNDLSISQRAIEITADTQSKIYGDVDPVLTYQITTGSIVGSDVFTGSLSRILGEDVGTYAINQGTLDNSNYDITFVSNDLTIAQRNILVLAEGKSKTYGDSDPILTYRIGLGNLVSGDAFNGSITRVPGEDVGMYTINQGTLTLGANYNMSFSDNTLMIASRSIEITADDHVKLIGTTDPALTYQITSGALQFSGAISGNPIRVTGEAIGDYAINQGTLSVGSNYNLTFVAGNLNITNLLSQVITFGALADQTFGNADFTLGATGGASGNPITYTSSNTSVATVSGNTVTIVGAGNTTITASQAGNATYAPATDVSQLLTVNKGNQTIMFDALANVTTNSADVNLTATASSGLGITYTSSDPSVATVSGNTVTVIGVGTTTITASQSGDNNWNAATNVTQVLTVTEGCFINDLPTNNFQIQAASETCTDKNNGIIFVNAVQNLDYVATINNQTYNFSSDLLITDLAPGNYMVCIAISGNEDCKQCFEMVIEEAPTLNGKTTVSGTNSNKQVLVEIETGTAPFTVTINDEVIGEFDANSFLIEAKNGDQIDVTSNVACEGKLSTTIDLFDQMTIFPNPTSANVTLTLPNFGSSTIAVSIHNALGNMVYSKVYSVVGSKVKLPMENLPIGVYFVTVNQGTSRTFKIIKK